MGSKCCKESNHDVFFSKHHCGKCRRKRGINVDAFKICEDCNEKLCESCVEKHKHCCCSRCCYGFENACCWGCVCKKTKRHIIVDIVDTPDPTPVIRKNRATSITPEPTPIPVPPLPPPPPRTTQRLVPVENRTFKPKEEEECCITCFDVFPNGNFVIADTRRGGWLYLFRRENRLLCNLFAASSETAVLDLAALHNHRFAYIDKINPRVIHFVQIGEKYRHMERQEKDKRLMDSYGRRIFCFDNQIFLTCTQPLTSASSILVLNVVGDKVYEIQCPDFCINSLAYVYDETADNAYIYVTDIEKGIRCFESSGGNSVSVHRDFRDIDVQWYYGITSDGFGNLFVCTQDELGPEIYKLELADPVKVKDMKLQLTQADGLVSPTMIRYSRDLNQFIVGSFDISFEKPIYTNDADNGSVHFQSKRGRHDIEGSDRQKHAQTNTPCRCTTLHLYKLDECNVDDPVRAIITPSQVNFDDRKKLVELIPEGKMSFKVDDVECSVSGYDILPRGKTDLHPSGKIVIADSKKKQICIFGPSTIPRNILICKMRLSSNLHMNDHLNILDVAALTDRRLVFVADNKTAIYFVVSGKRFRHMEIENVEKTKGYGRRVCYFENRLYIVTLNNAKTKSFIETLSLNGQFDMQPLMTIDCGDFHPVTSIAVNASYIWISSVAAGIRVYDHTGHLVNSFRDIDVQWYYGIARDKYDNWFICTQDELGPEIYEIKVDDNGHLVKGLCLRITEKEGLEPPLTLCYHPRLDLLMVGSNHIDKQNRGLDRFRQRTPSRDPYLIEKEARERFALEDVSWRTTDCDLYKIVYTYPKAKAQPTAPSRTMFEAL